MTLSASPRRIDVRAVDRICIGYAVLFAALLLAFGNELDGATDRAGEAGLVALGILAFVALAGNRAGLLRPLRVLYPLAFLMWAWTRLEGAVPVVFGSYWATDWLLRIDRAIFGGHPTVLVQALYRPWLDEAMAALYLSYYLFLAVPVLLVIRRRHDAALAGMAAIMLTYATNFLLFFLLPARSPAQVVDAYLGLSASRFDGFVATDLVRAAQSAEGVTGAAFPSSHVAGALVCTLVASRTLPGLSRLLWLLLAGMTLATVYLGYHHAIDTIAGIALGIVCFATAIRWLRSRGEIPGQL